MDRKVLLGAFSLLFGMLLLYPLYGDDGQQKTAKRPKTPFCICLLDEVVAFPGFSLYDADRHEDECSETDCADPTAVGWTGPKNLPTPEDCDEGECGSWSVRKDDSVHALEEPVAWSWSPYGTEEPCFGDEYAESAHIVNVDFMRFRANSRWIWAKVFLVRSPNDPFQPRPARFIAFGLEVERHANSTPTFIAEKVEQDENQSNFYHVSAGGITYHILTVAEDEDNDADSRKKR